VENQQTAEAIEMLTLQPLNLNLNLKPHKTRGEWFPGQGFDRGSTRGNLLDDNFLLTLWLVGSEDISSFLAH